MLRLTVMVLWLAFVAACGDSPDRDPPGDDTARTEAPATDPREAPSTPPAPEFRQAERPGVSPQAAEIDWSSARNDLAEAGSGGEATVSVQSGSSAPPVPVLLPSGPTVTAQAAGGETPALRQLTDGYYATFPGLDYDISVSGTNQVYGDAAADGDVAEDEAGDVDMAFLPTVSGAQVTLQRYGASYLIEFECKRLAGARGADCIDETEAFDVARNLVIAGSR